MNKEITQKSDYKEFCHKLQLTGNMKHLPLYFSNAYNKNEDLRNKPTEFIKSVS